MEELVLNKIRFTLPDGFVKLNEEEVQTMNLIKEGDDYGVYRNEERHIVASLAYKKANALLSLFVNEKEAIENMEKQIAEPMKAYGYERKAFVEENVAEEQAQGFNYTYEVSGVKMEGLSYILKEKNDLYYLHFYFRKENETKDLPLIKEILNSAKRV